MYTLHSTNNVINKDVVLSNLELFLKRPFRVHEYCTTIIYIADFPLMSGFMNHHGTTNNIL